MTTLIALAAISLAAAVPITAIAMVSAPVHRGEKHHTLTGEAPVQLTRVGRRLNGVYARTQRRTTAAGRAITSWTEVNRDFRQTTGGTQS